jgi:hypothetical protein
MIFSALLRRDRWLLASAALVLINANSSSVNAIADNLGLGVGSAWFLIGFVGLVLVLHYRINPGQILFASPNLTGILLAFFAFYYSLLLIPIVAYDRTASIRRGLSFLLVFLVGWRVLDLEPDFGFAPVPSSALEFYSAWQKMGLRLESVPLACDTTRYYPEPESERYADVKMAFVGGYWPKKAIQFDKYLRPYEDILTVYGYSEWPYKGYSGLLPENDERVLYQNACVSPAISEPHAEVMGDIVERVFKIMGSSGLAITDVVPFYGELFESDELLVPDSVEEYHDMVHQALTDGDFNQRYRERGYQAIQDRHTYAHRARTILEHLDMGIRQWI